MANLTHLAIIGQGVNVWNQWRSDRPEITPDLSGANLSRADLTGAKLIEAILREANLGDAKLGGVDVTHASVYGTSFVGVDLSAVRGLDTVHHTGPSVIAIDTIYLSKGNIPEAFLRRAGVPEDFITFMKSLTGEALDLYFCFICYSTKDQEFPSRLYAELQSEGVR